MFKLFHTPIKTPLKTRIRSWPPSCPAQRLGGRRQAALIRFGYGLNEESVQARRATWRRNWRRSAAAS